MIIAPSFLSADFAHLEREIEMLNKSEADMLHFDVMDGSFVPNISFGFPVMASLQPVVRKPMDIHMMVVHPELWIEKVASYLECRHQVPIYVKVFSLGIRRECFGQHLHLYPLGYGKLASKTRLLHVDRAQLTFFMCETLYHKEHDQKAGKNPKDLLPAQFLQGREHLGGRIDLDQSPVWSPSHPCLADGYLLFVQWRAFAVYYVRHLVH